MSHWKVELDAPVAKTIVFTSSIDDELARPTLQPKEDVERIGLKPPDYGGTERDEISKRVQNFKAHQQRFIPLYGAGGVCCFHALQAQAADKILRIVALAASILDGR